MHLPNQSNHSPHLAIPSRYHHLFHAIIWLLLTAVIWQWGWNKWVVELFQAPSIRFSHALVLGLMLLTLALPFHQWRKK